MVDGVDLADLLDCWEEQQEQNSRLTLDEFIAGSCHNTPPSLLAAFRSRVAQLEAMDRRLERIGADDTDGNPQAFKDTNPANSQVGSLASGAEPIAGYVLIERLGEGGFGQVWSASSPGGFTVALKFVRADDNAAKIELRALETIKAVRHPHLLTIFGAWQLDGRVVIASELADGTLLDRFRACVAAGRLGIPRDELLEYFAEAAKGIDFLNRPKSEGGHGIQHRDIKPQNILVSGGSVKVGDFGLARSMTHSATGHTGSLTLAYAAPEFLEGKTSDRSDQYSLAMTWCFLRTGKLPFEGTQAQVIAGHLHRDPDLSMLPVSERPVVHRALAKNPRERWNCCRDFVDTLRTSDPAPKASPGNSWIPPRMDTGIGQPQCSASEPRSEQKAAHGPRAKYRAAWTGFIGLLLAVVAISLFVLPKSDGVPKTSPVPNRPKNNLDSPKESKSESGSLVLPSEHLPDVTAGLVSHWPCDDVDGGLLTDTVGNRNGEVHGKPQTIPGVRGSALLFDGKADTIEMPTTTFPARFTIAAWVRPRESRAALCVFATKPPDVFGDHGFPDGIALFLNSNSSSTPNRKIHLQIHRATISTAEAAFTFDEWTHLAISVDNGTQHLNLFVNGKAQSDVTTRRTIAGNSQAPCWSSASRQDNATLRTSAAHAHGSMPNAFAQTTRPATIRSKHTHPIRARHGSWRGTVRVPPDCGFR